MRETQFNGIDIGMTHHIYKKTVARDLKLLFTRKTFKMIVLAALV